MGVLKRIGILAAVLAVGILGLAACPPGSRNLSLEPTGTNTFLLGTLTINDPGTYCVPQGGVALAGLTNITINSSDVVIVGETPDAPLVDSTAAPPVPVTITINAGVLNVVLRSFTVFESVTDLGAYQPLIDSVTFDDSLVAGAWTGGAAIILTGYQPEVRNCTFRMPTTPPPPGTPVVIQLAGGMNAIIHHNEVIGSGTPAPASFLAALVNYNGLQFYNNTANMIGNLVAADATLLGLGNLTNAVIRDNTATIYGPEPVISAGVGETAGIVVGGANIEITGNRLTVGNYDPSGAVPGVAVLILVLGTNVTVSGNTLDASLGLDNYTGWWLTGGVPPIPIAAAILTVGTNTTISDNRVEGVKNGPAISVYNAPAAGVAGLNAVITGNTIKNVVDPFVYDPFDGVVPGGANFDYDGDGNNEGAAIYICAINAKVRDNTIDGVRGSDGHGILLTDGNATLVGNTIRNVDDGVGIFVMGTMNNEIRGNTLEEIGQDGILLSYNNIAGTTFTIPSYADNNDVIENTLKRVAKRAVVDLTTPNPSVGDPLRGDYAGIRLNAASNNTIQNNTIENPGGLVWPAWICGVDVALLRADAQGPGTNPLPAAATTMNNDILGNTINFYEWAANVGSSAIGILVQAGQNHLVQGNTIHNTGNMQLGIDIRTNNRMEINENEIEGMVYAGLYLRGGTVTNVLTVKGNKFTDDYIGMVLSAGAADITDSVVQGGHIALYVDRFGVAGQYKVENNCFMDADILAQNDGTGTLVAQKNYWHPAPVAGTNIKGAVDFSNALASCPFAPAPGGLSHTYGAVAGWYMVSVPLASGPAADIFGTTLYRWNPAENKYDIVTYVKPHEGYWAKLPANKSVTDTGDPVTTDVTIDLGVAGWHMISAPWVYPKSAIRVIKDGEEKTWAEAVAAGWVRDTIYTYKATDGEYTTPDTLNPWYGYWVKAKVDGLSLKLLYSEATPLCATCAAVAELAPLAVEELGLPPAPPALTTASAGLEIVNEPNPVTDVHTTTFRVLGPMASQVELLRVRIFDLAGRLVWEGEAYGPELVWHTDNLAGKYLANGVYLYQVQVKVGGTWITTSLKKLAIYR